MTTVVILRNISSQLAMGKYADLQEGQVTRLKDEDAEFLIGQNLAERVAEKKSPSK